jgi:hypothetical protein
LLIDQIFRIVMMFDRLKYTQLSYWCLISVLYPVKYLLKIEKKL